MVLYSHVQEKQSTIVVVILLDVSPDRLKCCLICFVLLTCLIHSFIHRFNSVIKLAFVMSHAWSFYIFLHDKILSCWTVDDQKRRKYSVMLVVLACCLRWSLDSANMCLMVFYPQAKPFTVRPHVTWDGISSAVMSCFSWNQSNMLQTSTTAFIWTLPRDYSSGWLVNLLPEFRYTERGQQLDCDEWELSRFKQGSEKTFTFSEWKKLQQSSL